VIDITMNDKEIDGLRHVLYILQCRRIMQCSSPNRHPSYLAALYDIQLSVEAAIERLESGEQMYSTAETQQILDR
jgi:hypothetical protein